MKPNPNPSELQTPSEQSASEPPKTCNCWHEKDSKLREMGYKISDACQMLQIINLSLVAKFGIPLQRHDGKKLKKDDAKMITIAFCPFCGIKL